jgi:putative transposase
MYAYTTNCIETCISEKYQIKKNMWPDIELVLQKIDHISNFGRPSISVLRALNGIFYILKTGIQWNALPRCFGSYSAVHRVFKKLEFLGFFKQIWELELKKYIEQNPEALGIQAGDCSHIQAPLGQEATGMSPVNRSKLGSKRSIITDRNGVVIGHALAGGNTHDSKVFLETIRSIPSFVKQQFDWAEMHLDAAYDSEEIQFILFNLRYVPRINKNKRRNKRSQPACIAKRFFVEASHSWANRFKRLLIRFEKTAKLYSAFMNFAFAANTFSKIRL